MSKNAGTSSPPRPKSSSARGLAVEVLSRVWDGDAYAAPTLDAALRRAADLDPRDRRLATELVYGVLRTGGFLEQQLRQHASNDRWRRKAGVRANLLVAAYSLAFLDRVPAHAAVSEAVEAIKRSDDRALAGFANAVLRKLAKDKTTVSPTEARARSVPRWLLRALEDALGRESAAQYVDALDAPPLSLCLRAERDRDTWLSRLREAAPHATFEPGTVSPRAILCRGAGDHRRLPGAALDWVVQEEGAQLVALALGARPGDEVLDACAGRGNKTLWLAEAVGPSGAVDSADLHLSKLERLRAGPAGAVVRDTFGVDWTQGSGPVARTYDRVLVDAPCSGTGTLRRRPEITERLAASDITRMAALQLRITAGAASRVRPGGRLVYAVCSVLAAECEGVVKALTEGRDGPRLEPTPFDVAHPLLANATTLRLLPHVHGTDGYFMASFRVG